MNLLDTLEGWFSKHLDMHLDFTGDLMTPDWTLGDGDPVLRQELPATETIAEFVERMKGRKP
jgi:hypothetical protein